MEWMKKAAVVAAVVALAWAAMPGTAPAQGISPLQIGIGGRDLQLAPVENTVVPLRLSLPFSENAAVYGLDFGIFAKADKATAVQLNLFNFVEGPSAGVALAIYHTSKEHYGVTLAPFNYVDGVHAGIQLGFFPKADTVYGLQFGAINRARVLHGVQLGLVNILDSSDYPFMPVLRVGF